MFPADDPLMARLRSVFDASVPVGRVAGIPVRVRWTAALVFAVGVWQWRRWPGVGPLEATELAALSTLLFYLVVLTHELGHALAGRRVGAPFHQITLSVLGGLAHASVPLPGPGAEIRVNLAGPAVHGLWLGLAWGLERYLPPVAVGGLPVQELARFLFTFNLALLVFNLLPFFPMDGGRTLRALIALRRHPNEATLWACRLGILGGVAIAAWGLSHGGFDGTVLFVIGLNNAQVCMQEMTAARYSDGPYGPALEPWETDPDAWKSGRPARSAPRDERLWPRVLKGRRGSAPRPDDATPVEGTATATLDARTARTPEEEEELDRLLERVGRVGVSGLEPAERARLQSLSQRPRR